MGELDDKSQCWKECYKMFKFVRGRNVYKVLESNLKIYTNIIFFNPNKWVSI